MTIKEIEVTINYKVNFKDVEVPTDVYESLQVVYDCCMPIEDFEEAGYDVKLAREWINRHIKQQDAYTTETEISIFEEED